MLTIKAPIRGQDKYGSGEYLAPRGNRKHNGIDVACYAESTIFAAKAGTITKIGYPYDPNDKKKGHLRYVQITDNKGYAARYFYIAPTVAVDDKIKVGDPIGVAQGLIKIYPGIIDHIHFEVKNGYEFLNPSDYLEEVANHECI